MSASATASAYLHGFDTNYSINPPLYNDVMKMKDFPSAPLLLEAPLPSNIFGATTSVQFEWNSSEEGCSFLIRDADGSLHARGDVTSHNTIVRNINGMEMLKIVEGEPDDGDGIVVHTYRVFHKHALLGYIKVADKSPPRNSLQIIRGSGQKMVVNSFKIGDYAIFRHNLLSTPLCNLQMPDAEIYNPREFNVKIIFHPQTAITEDEQLLCTAAAIAFKTTMKQTTKIESEDGKCFEYFGAFICCGLFFGMLVLFYIGMEKWGCEHKKAQGYASYQSKSC